MIRILLSYVVIIVVVLVVTNLVAALALLPMFFLRGKKNVLPVCRLLSEGLEAFAAVGVVAWLYAHTSLRLSYLALLLPFLGIILNGFGRLDAAKQGRSGPLRLMASHGELDAYDQTNDIQTERFAIAGTVAGYLGGLVTFVGKLPLV